MNYRLVDELDTVAKLPWNPRAIFWSTVFAHFLCPFGWIPGLAWYALNWGRLEVRTHALLSWAVLLFCIPLEILLIGTLTLTQSASVKLVAVNLHRALPILVNVISYFAQARAVEQRRRRAGVSASLTVPLVIVLALSTGWILLVQQLSTR